MILHKRAFFFFFYSPCIYPEIDVLPVRWMLAPLESPFPFIAVAVMRFALYPVSDGYSCANLAPQFRPFSRQLIVTHMRNK